MVDIGMCKERNSTREGKSKHKTGMMGEDKIQSMECMGL